MAEFRDSKRGNGKLSLYPLRLDKAVKAIMKVKPEARNVHDSKATEEVKTK